MVKRIVLLVAAVAGLIAFVPTGCKDSSHPDLGIFNPCDPADLGTASNPSCPPDAPLCHPQARVCVGCIPSFQTCLPGYECNETYSCVPVDVNRPCVRSVDCPKRVDGFNQKAIVCDVDGGGVCRVCLSDTDCVAPDHCINYECQTPDGGV